MILLTRIAFSMIASRVASFGRCRMASRCLGAGGGSTGWLLLEKITAERLGAQRVPGGEDLGDHAAHRRADDMCGVDLEVIEQGGGVVGDVLERVDRGAFQAEK